VRNTFVSLLWRQAPPHTCCSGQLLQLLPVLWQCLTACLEPFARVHADWHAGCMTHRQKLHKPVPPPSHPLLPKQLHPALVVHCRTPPSQPSGAGCHPTDTACLTHVQIAACLPQVHTLSGAPASALSLQVELRLVGGSTTD
jgi:hypothetical protein